MTKEFINFYEKNLVVETKLLKGVMYFLEWAKSNQISMGVCTNKQENLAKDLLKKLNITSLPIKSLVVILKHNLLIKYR